MKVQINCVVARVEPDPANPGAQRVTLIAHGADPSVGSATLFASLKGAAAADLVVGGAATLTVETVAPAQPAPAAETPAAAEPAKS